MYAPRSIYPRHNYLPLCFFELDGDNIVPISNDPPKIPASKYKPLRSALSNSRPEGVKFLSCLDESEPLAPLKSSARGLTKLLKEPGLLG